MVDGTTVLAIGGERGAPFRVSPWEFAFAGAPALREKRYKDAKASLLEGLEHHPDNLGLVYDLACVEALMGDREAALGHLEHAFENPRFREWAKQDSDLESLRDHPRFSRLMTPGETSV